MGRLFFIIIFIRCRQSALRTTHHSDCGCKLAVLSLPVEGGAKARPRLATDTFRYLTGWAGWWAGWLETGSWPTGLSAALLTLAGLAASGTLLSVSITWPGTHWVLVPVRMASLSPAAGQSNPPMAPQDAAPFRPKEGPQHPSQCFISGDTCGAPPCSAPAEGPRSN